MLFIYLLDTLDAVKWPLVVSLQTTTQLYLCSNVLSVIITLKSTYKIVQNSS